MKIRLSRLNAWLKRLQWPLAWKGFYRPSAAPAPLFQPLTGAVEPVVVEKIVTIEVPAPAPDPVVVEKIVYVETPRPPFRPPWDRSRQTAVAPPIQPKPGKVERWDLRAESPSGRPAKIVLRAPLGAGCHVVTSAYARYSDEAEGDLSIVGVDGFSSRKVKGQRQMGWCDKPPRGVPGEPVEIVLQGVEGASAALSACGYTEWEVSDAQD